MCAFVRRQFRISCHYKTKFLFQYRKDLGDLGKVIFFELFTRFATRYYRCLDFIDFIIVVSLYLQSQLPAIVSSVNNPNK
jgi:hypothetical protein